MGGEPFFSPQFETCLEFLETHHNPELELNIISNLKISSSKLETFIKRIEKMVVEQRIKRLDITASIDCFGSEQEYVRFGLDLDQWRKNFEYLAKQEWIILNINQTLSGLTIKTIPELLQYINDIRQYREVGHFFSLFISPTLQTKTLEFLHPEIFGKGFWNVDFDKIFNHMPEKTHQQQESKLYMTGIHKLLNTHQRDYKKIKQLSIYLDEIDRRRSTNWKITFPWLVKEIENVV
jgi:ribosomal protein L25 (general stress protein Ctc)